ncbi:MAG: diaminopropionate ammonia-lyase [Bifidobacteriaceae bacterium]|nr:diaminopropionate ammonia-lyase [Bifidobacteriaceae bacterium]
MQVLANPNKGTRASEAAKMLTYFTAEEIAKVVAFHSSIDGYKPTPLVVLNGQAQKLGVKAVYVKDESHRFGLNAFKALGGSFAIGKYLAHRLGKDISELSYEEMISDQTKAALGDITFITATDGNHGRGVAWTANKLRQKCVVHMPKGSAPERLANIQALGAQADITDLNYDDAVRLSNEEAEKYGWALVQDTSWPGYEDIPISIVQGYSTLIYEAFQEFDEQGLAWPTHVFAQAGVGAFATAVTAGVTAAYAKRGIAAPTLVVVEPHQAACIFDTLRATDRRLHPVTGDMDTIMAGLACGEPVTVGVDILAHCVDFVVSAPDYVAAQGMRALSSPPRQAVAGYGTGLGEAAASRRGDSAADPRIISGESGAVTFGFVHEVCSDPDYAEFRTLLGIDQNSVVLCVSTEGDTDRAGYDRIVTNGAYPRPTS